MSKSTPSEIKPILCPCCDRETDAPTFDVVAQGLKLSPMQSHVLEAIWFGNRWDKERFPTRNTCGYIVGRGAILDSMYRDDCNGGPSDTQMNASLKWHTCHLRKVLVGSGVHIDTVLGQGYRLVLSEQLDAVS